MSHWLTVGLLPILYITWLLAWPIKPDWMIAALDVEVVLGGASRCPHGTACYADEQIYVNLYTNESGRSLRDQYLHEMQHHFQAVAGMSEWPGGYGVFIEALRGAIASGRYTDKHQVRTMKAMVETWPPFEAHADLPLLLDGEIPPEVAKWYPWFDLSSE